jgi:hypothetical protein
MSAQNLRTPVAKVTDSKHQSEENQKLSAVLADCQTQE